MADISGWSKPTVDTSGWQRAEPETPEERRAREEGARTVSTLTGGAAPQPQQTPAEQTVDRLGLDRPASRALVESREAVQQAFLDSQPKYQPFGAAFMAGLNDLGMLTSSAFEAVGEAGGLDTLASAGERGRERFTHQGEEQGRRGKFTDIRTVGDALGWARQTTGNLIPVMVPAIAGSAAGAAVGTVGAVAGAFVPSTILGVGEVQAQMKEKDPQSEANAWVFVGGSAIGALDTVLPGKVGSKLVGVFGRESAEEIAMRALLRPASHTSLAHIPKEAAKGLMIEGLTESVQEAIGEVTASLAANQEIDWESLPESMIEAGAAGALMGGGVGATTGTAEVAGARRTQREIEEGRRDRALNRESTLPPLTESDRASPFSDAVIQTGKAKVDELLKNNPITGGQQPGPREVTPIEEAPSGWFLAQPDATLPEPAPPPKKAPAPVPVEDGIAAARKLFPEAEFTSGYRGPEHPLTKANPKSWHSKSHAALDMEPVPGITFEQAKQRFIDAGYTLIEALDETGDGKTAHATGDHWHFVLGLGGEGITVDSETPAESALPSDEELARAARGSEESAADLLKNVLGEDVLEPRKGERVEVTRDGQTVPGVVEEAWERDGRQGVRIRQDDGTIFDEALEDARDYGARITRPVTQVESVAPSGATAAATGNQDDSTADLAGEPIDKDWVRFRDESGHIGISRADMPQIKAGDRGAMVNFLKGRGIAHEEVEISPRSLKPSQAEFSPAKVQKAREHEGGDRAILISADGYVVDGHHQWLAARDSDQPIRAIKLNAPIREVLDAAGNFPSSRPSDENAAREEAPQGEARIEPTTSGKGIAVIDASAEQMAAIGRAAPKAKGVPRKDGAIVYSKKHEAEIRAALAGGQASSKTVETQSEESSQTVDNAPISADQRKKLWNSKGFKKARKALGDPHQDSEVATAMVRGWMDGEQRDLERLRAAVADAERTAEGVQRDGSDTFNPRQGYLEAFYAAVTGKTAEIRAKGGFRDVLSPAQALAEIEGGPAPEPQRAEPEIKIRGLADGTPLAEAAAAARRAEQRAERERTMGDRARASADEANAQQKAEQASEYGAKNKLVTQDRAAELREKLKEKLNPNRLNAGIDPELVAIGTELAVFHIEAGARRFADFARAMARDLDMPLEGLRKYLRGWYNGARDFMEDSGESVAGMDTADEVGRAMRTFTDWAEDTTPEPQETAAAAPSEPAEGTGLTFDQGIIQAIATRLETGERFETITEARKALSEMTGETIKAGTAAAKRADEMIEAALVHAAQVIVARNESKPLETYRALVGLYDRQPRLGVRSSTSIEQQAYSTPLPLAWLASTLAEIAPGVPVYEPSAGNGALLIGTGDARAVTANELNAARAAQLRILYPGAVVTENDAMTDNLAPKQFGAVIANPPFGAVKEGGETVRFDLEGGYRTGEIDHAISMKALEKLRDDGKAVLIVGGLNKMITDPAKRSDAYNAKAKREFYWNLYNEYNVTDHFTVAGELWAKQGAGWPVDVIVIQGRGKSALPLPAVTPPKQFGSWADLETKLADANVSVPRRAGSEDGATPAGFVPERTARDDAGIGERSDGRGAGVEGPDAGRGRAGAVERGTGAGERPGRGADQEAGRGLAEEPGDVRDAGRDRQRLPVGEDGEALSQVPYTPASGKTALETLVPANMAFATDDALRDLTDRVGNIDAFVADRLDYPEADLGNYFSAEQIDALALAIDNMDRDAGFIIGDQTGIGKGRVVAGLIRYAIKIERMPIFVTEKPGLYGDMHRDLTDIDIQGLLGREPNIVMTNAAQTVTLDDGSDLKTPAATKHNQRLYEIARGDREGVDMLFTTYSQMQTIGGKQTPRQAVLEAMAPGAIIIFDESHNAGGQGQVKDGRAPSKNAAPNRAQFARQLAAAAKGVVFSSATYAKRPEVMDLYAKTDMRMGVDNIDNLAEAIKRGGVALQQIVASMLARAGQYIRRERSFEGVDYRTPRVAVDREIYEQFTQAMREVLDFERTYVEPAFSTISTEIKKEGAIKVGDSTIKPTVTNVGFTATMHNLISQLLLAMKADSAADMAIAALKDGKKPVIALSNTMEAMLTEFAEQAGLKSGDRAEIDFRDLLKRYLERTRRYSVRLPNADKSEARYISDGELGHQGVNAFREVVASIDSMDIGKLPASPLDWITHRIEQAGYKVGEVTGRDLRIDYGADGGAALATRGTKATSVKGKRATIDGFNAGTVDTMILNQSGATGVSLHASEKFKDQRQRQMIIAQPELNIDTHMQMLGRIHRTGQVELPGYDQLIADVPAEMRPAAVLAKKMASLNANTTGARDSAVTSDEVPDFLNEYGDEIAAQMMQEDTLLHEALDNPLNFDGDDWKEDAAKKVTGKLMLLPIAEQEAFYERFTQAYLSYLEEIEASGGSTLEAKTMDFDARTEERVQVRPAKDARSPFGEGIYNETINIKRQSPPISAETVVSMLSRAIDTEETSNPGDLPALAAKGKAWMGEFTRPYFNAFDAYVSTQIDSIKDFSKKTETRTKLRDLESMVRARLNYFAPGATLKITEKGGEPVSALVIGVEKANETKNPLAPGSFRVTLAAADGRIMAIPLSQVATGEDTGTTNYHVATYRAADIAAELTEGQSDGRETRSVYTGNILAAYEYTSATGRIINFTDDEGGIRPGLLMPKGYNHEKAAKLRPIRFETGAQVAQWLENISVISANTGGLTISYNNYGGVQIETNARKDDGGKFYLNEAVRAVTGDFYKQGRQMRASIRHGQIGEAAQALIDAGAVFEINPKLMKDERLQQKAREIAVAGAPAAAEQPRARSEEQQSWGEALEGRDAEVRAALEAQLEQFGISDRITLEAVRGLKLTSDTAAGQSWNGVISIALDNARDPGSTLAHETIHAMRDLGLFTPAEWRNLENVGWGDPTIRAWVQSRYPGADLNTRREEAAAEHFARYWQQGKKANSLWGRAMRRIQALAAAIARAVNTMLGRPVDSAFEARLVQDKIISGEIGARATGSQAPTRGGTPRTFGKKETPRAQASAAAFADPESEKRWTEATKGIGDGPSTVERAREWWTDLKNGFTRHWRALPNEARFADLQQQFRKLEAAPDAAMDASVRYLKGLVGKMDKAEYDLFSRKVVLDDLAWEAASDHQLPFGLTPETLREERAKIDALIDASPKLVEAVRSRKLHNKRLADDMVRAGVLTREQIKNPAYFRHMVLDYARHEARMARSGQSKIKSPYWARRLGSSLDINANLLEAELDWMLKARTDIATADTISWVKESSHNIRDQLRDQARASNSAAIAEKIRNNSTLEAEEKVFRQRIAQGMAIVKSVLERGELEIPSHLEAAARAITSGTRGGEPPFALFAWLLDNRLPGAMGAGMVLKYSGLRKAWTREHLGEAYLDPDDVDVLVKRLKPEGFKSWQPREGRHFFTAKTMSESALDMFIGKLADTVYPGVERDELRKALSTIRPQLVVGGDRYTMVLPEEIADTLTEFGDRRIEGAVAKVFSGVQSAWKRWVLINPRRFLKYNINNLSGDLDAIIAGNPGTLKKVRAAWNELRQAAKGEASARYTEAMDRGVFTSGLTIQEIPDINRLSAMRHLTEDRGILNQLTIGSVAAVWRALNDSTQFRENLFRMAAYLDYVEKIEAGQDQLSIGYGGSVPALVNAVTDPKDRAALLARDLVGDYGAISVAGGWLRKYLIPFWSWTEINTRRYWRLTSNAYSQSKAKGIATGGLLGVGVAARTAVWMAVRMGTVYGLLWLWNNLLFEDEEDDLGDLQKRQLHMVLGRDSDGEVITLRTQGALSDVLGMFGFFDAMAGIKAWENGQGTIGQAATAAAKAPINRILTATTPIFSNPLQMVQGKEWWPDFFEPRTMHDRGRFTARTFSLENEYDLALGNPTRGYGRSWAESLVYKRDPGEMAYDTAKGIAYDWLEKVKGQSGSFGSTPRSAALREYRMALRYGDQEAADEALLRYAEFDGTERGLKTSIKSQHPLGPIAKKDRAAFLDSLTDEQLETLAEAEEWYNRIYLGIEPEE